MESKKKVFYGEEGHKAEVTEEQKSTSSEEAIFGKELLKKAAILFAPEGAQYCGSACVHYYKKSNAILGEENYFTVCQAAMEDVNEGAADIGWKNLRGALMKVYGRKEPKVRS